MLKDKEKQCTKCKRIFLDLFNNGNCPFCKEFQEKGEVECLK